MEHVLDNLFDRCGHTSSLMLICWYTKGGQHPWENPHRYSAKINHHLQWWLRYNRAYIYQCFCEPRSVRANCVFRKTQLPTFRPVCHRIGRRVCVCRRIYRFYSLSLLDGTFDCVGASMSVSLSVCDYKLCFSTWKHISYINWFSAYNKKCTTWWCVAHFIYT